MDLDGAFHDPLMLNLNRQTRILISRVSPTSPHVEPLRHGLAYSQRDLLATLSSLLAVPSLTLTVANLFRPILIPLCAQWLADPEQIEEKLVALCLLIQPHEELFPILSRLLRQPPLDKGILVFISSSEDVQDLDTLRLHRLLLAYYRILIANRSLPSSLSWPLSTLSMLFWTPHPDTGVRLLAIRCYALQSGMSEAEREKLETEVLGPIWEVDCQLHYEDVDGKTQKIDGWLLPALESKRVIDARNAIIQDHQEYYIFDEGEEPQTISIAELSPSLANIHGIFLLRSPGLSEIPSGIVQTPTVVQSLRSLASHLSLRLPILLTSPPSSGKSLLLSHLAASLYEGATNQIITIHLADTSLDARSLLGAYVSSVTEPGTFEWKEGVLIRAMREGKWVVFKDIDRATSEVLGVIKPLVESLGPNKWIGGVASLDVPSRGRVHAHEQFSIFATRSTAPAKKGTHIPATFFGANKFQEIIVQPPTSPEVKAIILVKFPLLGSQVAVALIRLWDVLRLHGSARGMGYRELEKFCARVEHLLRSARYSNDLPADGDEVASLEKLIPNPTLREEIYLEARDVFFGAGALTALARAQLEAIATTIAQQLGLETDRRDWILHRRVPDFQLDKDTDGKTIALRIGKTTLLPRPTKIDITLPTARPFALHRPAVLLLSRIATALSFNEPILLTGETGTGKTSIVTYISSILNRPLISLNLSHQTESSDLIGGFKPIDTRIPATQLQQRFLDLFGETFSRRKNAKFEESVRKAVMECKWKRAVGLWRESVRLAKDRLQAKQVELSQELLEVTRDEDAPRKRRKTERHEFAASEARWSAFERDVNEFEVQHVQGKGKFVFGFVDGPIVKALRAGHWVLLDEINLASAETLECIAGLLQGPQSTITLTEQGFLEPVPRHPDFRLFACMNPATDVGKKDLPANIRSRFTEIDVPPPDSDQETLLSIITQYIGNSAVSDKAAILNVAEFYLAVKKLLWNREIADGSNHTPHYSIRTLTRALTFAADMASAYGLRRALWEGCLMAFTMILDPPSVEMVVGIAHQYLMAGVRNPRSLLSREPSAPRSQPVDNFIKFGHFYLAKGPLPEDLVEDYIITPSVERKLLDLARIMVTRRYPVLIEGPTSSGKTSSVEYLARRTGHRFIRINNHEHTDIQEYLGSYVSDPATGKLVFKDGLLVQALREGHWIVLDELNLAPTDVLEALNRLLDDNRELVIPETQEVVRPHPHFMLFATQNPSGLYAGRKVLSRAFRSRFLEVHFQDVPQIELEHILCQKCRIAPSYAAKIVNVFRELQKRRQSSRVFESRHSFATLRDLFRWAGRDAIGYQQLAENGYMLLGERTRRDDDKQVVKEVIEQEMRVKIDENAIYNVHNPNTDYLAHLGVSIPSSPQVVWTSAMQRLFVLVARALQSNEPVLLVGETGSGKTSVCQIYADAVAKRLYSLSCHQNTETADLIGGLRPIRNRAALKAEVLRDVSTILRDAGISNSSPDETSLLSLIERQLKPQSNISGETRIVFEECRRRILRLSAIFEWRDGPLVEAMRHGDVFLLDEISLADDSVLERLNSVLEPSRTIVLAERGGDDIDHADVRALDSFKIIATMNPGGDYGKKELSPALRNRFTEIWVPPVHERGDLELIIASSWEHPAFHPYTTRILDFVNWLVDKIGDRSVMSLRDLLAWVNFSNSLSRQVVFKDMSVDDVFHHSACMTVLDGLGSLPQAASYSPHALLNLKSEAFSKLREIAPHGNAESSLTSPPVFEGLDHVEFGPFCMTKRDGHALPTDFYFHAPTTLRNAARVARACQLPKAILLEGSPGVGKTSLVTALAQICGHTLHRINLSDQTDLVDLFGSDLPVDGGQPGEFAWKDAEFLKALQEGHWVLLDEMNLAPQAILEGLNAVLDHRGSVFIPELGRSFIRHPEFRIFAAQNPVYQGGGRKGLPKSFINRFTKVYLDDLSPDDLFLICRRLFPACAESTVCDMITFNTRLNEEIISKRSFATEGSPWEFNLRDVIRWLRLICTAQPPQHPADCLGAVYLHRFRTVADREHARFIFEQIFPKSTLSLNRPPYPSLSSLDLQIGNFRISRRDFPSSNRPGRILQTQLHTMEAIGYCITQSWLSIITGRFDCGKTELIRTLAHATGNELLEISINNATDAMDILGSFEQVNSRVLVVEIIRQTLLLVEKHFRTANGSKSCQSEALAFLHLACRTSFPPESVPRLLHAAADVLMSSTGWDAELGVQCEDLLHRIQQMATVPLQTGRFEWVDGPLVRAVKQGHWALLDGANLCNPSVLDRLNSLCEPNGCLVLSERGYVDGKIQSLVPHPNFRLFMTVDPRYGELSRAMRNRGIEMAMLVDPTTEDCARLREHARLPTAVTRFSDSHSLMLQFDGFRRGLFLSPTPPSLQASSWPSELFMSEDFGMSDVIEQTTPIFTSSRALPLDSVGNVFARIPSPKYLLLVDRLCVNSATHVPGEVVHRLRTLLRVVLPPFFSLTQSARETIRSTRSLPASFISTQPADVLLHCSPCHDCKILPDSNHPSPHRVILETLNFCVALHHYQDDLDKFLSTKPRRRAAVQMDGPDAQISQAVEVILEAIPKTFFIFQESLNLSESRSSLLSVELAISLINLCRHLLTVTVQTPLNFSAIRAISARSGIALCDSPSHLMQLRSHFNKLEELISLSSGAGVTEIWSTFSDDGRIFRLSAELNRLDILLSNTRPSEDHYHLRKSVLNWMVTSSSTLESVRDDAMLSRLTEQLQQSAKIVEDDGHINRAPIEPSHLFCELIILSGLSGSHTAVNSHAQHLQDIMNMACEETHCGILRFVPYQHLLSSQVTTAMILQCQIQWLRALWEYHVDGPSQLLGPTHLQVTLSKCDLKKRSLVSLDVYRDELARHCRITSILSEHNLPRIKLLTSLLRRCVVMVLVCFPSSFDIPIGQVEEIVLGKQSGKAFSADHTIPLLEHCTDKALRDSVVAPLQHLDLQLSTDSHFREHTISNLGRCFFELSKLILDRYVPDVPIDPAAIRHFTEEMERQRKSSLSSELDLHTQMEQRVTGNTDNPLISYLSECRDKISGRLLGTRSFGVRDFQNASRLRMFWQEVTEFRSKVISNKVDTLIRHLERNQDKALSRENALQRAISGFLQRLNTIYSDFSDLIIPVELALLYLSMGIRLVAEGVACRNTSDSNVVHSLVKSLVAFPTIQSVSPLLEDLPSSVLIPSRQVLIRLAALNFEISIGVDVRTHMLSVDTSFEQIVRLWLVDRAKKDDMELASQSLYKSQILDHEVSNEMEMEEREFLALFPQFENVLDPEAQTAIPSRRPVILDASQTQMLVEIHHSLIGASFQGDSLKIFHNVRESETEDLLETHMSSLTEVLDQESFPLQFTTIRKCLSRIREAPRSESCRNFYVDANIAEISKAGMIIGKLNKRLDELIDGWPDHMVLQLIKKHCDLILRFNLLSPVAKMLCALEQLLAHTQDWEDFANRENSFKSHLQELTELIIDWRRLELSSWQELLQTEAKIFADGASDWWFHLYNSTIRGSLDLLSQCNSDGADELVGHLSNLCPLLDGFMRSSPLGQYHSRLQLLRSFSIYARHIALIKPPRFRLGLQRIERVLHATFQFYEQFEASIDSQLAQQRATVETELRGFIKLASWRDTNIYSLKQSAQKTHRQLYKCVRKFRNILKQPVTQWLYVEKAATLEPSHLSESILNHITPSTLTLPPFPNRPSQSSHAAHLSNLERTYEKFAIITTGRIQSVIQSHTTASLEDFAVEIISTAKMLSSLSIPINESADKREQIRKGRLVRKRRAWSDLLKELKRVGFAANIKPDDLNRLRDVSWIRQQPNSADLSGTSAILSKSEAYLSCLYGLLPDLRESLSDHHSDVTTRELQRGVNFLESGFSMALETRSCLVLALVDFRKLEDVTRRLRMALSSSQLLQGHTDLLDRVTHIKNTLCRFSSALSEVMDGFRAYDDLHPDRTTPQSLLDHVSALSAKATLLRDGMTAVLDNMKLVDVPFLLLREERAIRDVIQYVRESSESLHQLSQQQPHYTYMLEPVAHWIASQEMSFPTVAAQTAVHPHHDTDTVINALLVNVQNLLATCERLSGADLSKEGNSYVRQDHKLIAEFTRLLKLNDILDQVNSAIPYVVSQPEDAVQYSLARLLPFLDCYLQMAKEHLNAQSQWLKSLCKLDYVLCSVMLTLAKQGFCQPPDSNDAQPGGDTGDAMDGLGIGEGVGTENVSKEIEEDSQVEGLQNDVGDSNDTEDGPKEDNAVDMTEDFDGELEDVPDTGSQGEEDSDNESQPELEDKQGKLDSADPSAVDEKLWGDDKNDADKTEDKFDQGRSKQTDGEGEVAAKEHTSSPTDKHSEQDQPRQENDADEESPEPMDIPENDDCLPDAGLPSLDNAIPESEILDLPDDMNFDEEKGDQQDSDVEMMDDDLSEGASNAGDNASESQVQDDSENVEQAQKPVQDDTMQPELDDVATGQPDLSADQNSSRMDDPSHRSSGDDSSSAEQTPGQHGKGQNAENNQIPNPEKQETLDPDTSMNDAPAVDQGKAASVPTGSRQDAGPTTPDQQSSIDAPRSLGDVGKETRRPFEDIQHGEGINETPLERPGNAGDESQLEYLRPDDRDDMQALGPAGAEQVARLQDLSIMDGSHDESGQPIDLDSLPAIEDRLADATEFSNPTETSLTGIHEKMDIEGAVIPRPERPDPVTNITRLPGTQSTPPDVQMSDESEDVRETDVETELRAWQAEGLPADGAEHIWRRYESLTHDLAYALCEQLRLILEPTLATRLKGDYRSGKRLNMKKIIPYIASDYTKDKIWLRRTRPSQREYQVLIALDDSRSMSESHSVHLAYQTLALVSKALGRLEVGDLAIAKFGERMDILHGFEEGPFTDQAGVNVLGSFRFSQTSTNVLSLLEASLHMLEVTRERRSMSSHSVADLWQLEIIISDGICQDHERLRTILRKAEEQRVMIVFIIIDSLSSSSRSSTATGLQNSILSMKQASYKMVNGRMELQMQRYLDTFPFEYHVVLRSVEALPDILSATLKQFFERVSGE